MELSHGQLNLHLFTFQAGLEEVKSILKQDVKGERDLVVGTLENGFR